MDPKPRLPLGVVVLGLIPLVREKPGCRAVCKLTAVWTVRKSEERSTQAWEETCKSPSASLDSNSFSCETAPQTNPPPYGARSKGNGAADGISSACVRFIEPRRLIRGSAVNY